MPPAQYEPPAQRNNRAISERTLYKIHPSLWTKPGIEEPFDRSYENVVFLLGALQAFIERLVPERARNPRFIKKLGWFDNDERHIPWLSVFFRHKVEVDAMRTHIDRFHRHGIRPPEIGHTAIAVIEEHPSAG